jgi:hypothetical protein
MCNIISFYQLETLRRMRTASSTDARCNLSVLRTRHSCLRKIDPRLFAPQFQIVVLQTQLRVDHTSYTHVYCALATCYAHGHPGR